MPGKRPLVRSPNVSIRAARVRPGPVRLVAWWGLLAALVGVCAQHADAQEATPPPVPINESCPVMQDEPVDPRFTTTYEGRVIGFCCEKCLARFEANPARYAARLTALVPPTLHATTSDGPAREQGIDEATGYVRAHNSTEVPTKSPGPRFIAWLGKFHLPMVNFPIAMLAGAALAELLLMASKRPYFAAAGRYCLWVGGVGAVVAAMLGWFFAGFRWEDDAWLLAAHRWLGTSTALWSVLVLFLGERVSRRPNAPRTGYRAVLLVGAGLVSVTGFFGGSLIYGLDHYAW